MRFFMLLVLFKPKGREGEIERGCLCCCCCLSLKGKKGREGGREGGREREVAYVVGDGEGWQTREGF